MSVCGTHATCRDEVLWPAFGSKADLNLVCGQVGLVTHFCHSVISFAVTHNAASLFAGSPEQPAALAGVSIGNNWAKCELRRTLRPRLATQLKQTVRACAGATPANRASLQDIDLAGISQRVPVQQPTNFELAINLKTVKTLSATVPSSSLARAEEMIE